MPSSKKAKDALFALLPSVIDGDIFELGAGWGTLALPLARQFPTQRIIAYELSWIPFVITWIRARGARLSNLSVSRSDFYTVPCHSAGLIVCYLYPEAMRMLKPKFEKELRPGTWIASNTFAIPGWKPHKILEINDLYKTKVYLYKME